jgi:hypothetical protein
VPESFVRDFQVSARVPAAVAGVPERSGESGYAMQQFAADVIAFMWKDIFLVAPENQRRR